MNYLFTLFITMLIRRAQRTPYYHLTGYMERFWLVPYKTPIYRTLDRSAEIDGKYYHWKSLTRDGTGPVGWGRPFAKLMQAFDYACRVHHILRSDHGRDPHNHPWPYLTVILLGGYWETLYNADGSFISKLWHGPGSVLYRPANTWHRLDVNPGETAWTLFFTGTKQQKWGFNVDGKQVNHDVYHGKQ